MNIQEYKQRKDKFRNDMTKLIEDFNKDTDTVIQEIEINVVNGQYVGKSPQLDHIRCKLITDIDE